MGKRKGARFDYRNCAYCGKEFAVNKIALIHDSKHCSKCARGAWFAEMEKLGCDVSNPAKLGDMPIVVNKTIKDCSEVISGGIKYKDVTELIFYDTKHRKVYHGDPEWEGLKNRPRQTKRKSKVKDVIHKRWTAEEVDELIYLKQNKYTNEQIGEELERTTSSVMNKWNKVKREGEINVLFR